MGWGDGGREERRGVRLAHLTTTTQQSSAATHFGYHAIGPAPLPLRAMIFVDHSGNRRRALAVLGIGLGLLLVAGLIALSLPITKAWRRAATKCKETGDDERS